jgi:hypothetical protein
MGNKNITTYSKNNNSNNNNTINNNNNHHKGDRTENIFINLSKEKNNNNPIKEKNNEIFREEEEEEKKEKENNDKNNEDNYSNKGNLNLTKIKINQNSSEAKTECQSIPENLEMSYIKIPTLFEWKEGGENVYVAGSFSNWNEWHVMDKINNKFVLTLVNN